MASASTDTARRRPPRTDENGNLLRLVPNQFELLSWVYLEMHLGKEEVPPTGAPVIWSPKAYLNRSPTNAEASTLSKRLGVLIKHGLVKRRGRLLTVTRRGVRLLKNHIRTLDPDAVDKLLPLFLRFDDVIRDRHAQRRLIRSLPTYQDYTGADAKAVAEIKRALGELAKATQQQMSDLRKDVQVARQSYITNLAISRPG